jgi:MFS family permease
VFINAASALAVPMAGAFADWWARRRPGGRMLAQACGLLAGSGLVAVVGLTGNVPTLLVTMTLFGICKGLYDAGIFASLYDVVHPRSRGTAAGLMNTVGWGVGALGPTLTGWYADHGPYETKAENMSHFIAFGGAIYLVGGLLLLAAVFFLARRDVATRWDTVAAR